MQIIVSSFTLQNCVDAISDRISDQIGVIGGVSIAIAVLLVRYAVPYDGLF